MIKQQIDADLKTAMLAADSKTVTVLRGLKSAILYAEVAAGARERGLDEQAIIQVLAKEAKKRQESADLYKQGGDPIRMQAELDEKAIIENYLPRPLSDERVAKIVDQVIADAGSVGPQDMGRIIGKVRDKTAGAADGSVIARLVKERLTQ